MAHHSRGTWGLEGDHGLGATNLMSKSVYPTMTAVKSVYARHLTETNGLFPYVYRTSGELRQAKTVRGRRPSDGPVYPCKTDTVSSPNIFFRAHVLYDFDSICDSAQWYLPGYLGVCSLPNKRAS